MSNHLCEMAQDRMNGWDGEGGHNQPVRIQQMGNSWHLVCPDWYSVDIVHCPFCGVKLEEPDDNEEAHEPAFTSSTEELAKRLADMIEAVGTLNTDGGEQ